MKEESKTMRIEEHKLTDKKLVKKLDDLMVDIIAFKNRLIKINQEFTATNYIIPNTIAFNRAMKTLDKKYSGLNQKEKKEFYKIVKKETENILNARPRKEIFPKIVGLPTFSGQMNTFDEEKFLKQDTIHKHYLLKIPNRLRWEEYIKVNEQIGSYNTNEAIQKVADQFKSYISLKKKGFTDANLPGFIQDTTEIVLTVKKDYTRKGKYIYFKQGVVSSKFLPKRIKVVNKGILKQVAYYKVGNQYKMNLIFELPEVIEMKEDNERYLGIDLGIKNFATAYSNVSYNFIIKGTKLLNKLMFASYKKAKILHEINKGKTTTLNKKQQEKNKEVRRKGKKVPYKRVRAIGNTKETIAITNKTNNYVRTFVHTASKRIIDYCIENDINTIIIGMNKNFKYKAFDVIKGKKTNRKFKAKMNRKFISLPYRAFIEKLTYKAKEKGIIVKEVEESYTSMRSFYHFEPLNKGNYESKLIRGIVYNGKKTEKLSKLIEGQIINADLNGAANIIRKAVGDKEILNPKNVFKSPVVISG